MIKKLAVQLVDFPGDANHARCFTHILNLVVKSIMHQFDVPKKWRKWSSHTNDTTRDLLDLAGDIDEEELATVAEAAELELEDPDQDETDEGPSLDNDDGWIDEQGDMIQPQIDALEESVRPVTVVLTKVRE